LSEFDFIFNTLPVSTAMMGSPATGPAVISVNTRPATLKDLTRLHELINISYRSDRCWTNESTLVKDARIEVKELSLLIESGIDPILVAELDGKVVGCVQAECKFLFVSFSLCCKMRRTIRN
jgi:N-acetylglutamate synthase-like GNAT family acetyltransferase